MAANQRKYIAQFKAKVVLEVLRGEKSPADACRSYKIHNSVLTRWKREFLERAPACIGERGANDAGGRAHCRVRTDGGTVGKAARDCKKGITDLERRQKQQLVKQLSQEDPVAMVCRVFEVSRSSLYYKPVEPQPDDGIKTMIAALAAEHPTYGYRRITALLHRAGHKVNNKRVRRMMGEMGLVGKSPKQRCRTTNSNHLLPRYPNQVEGRVVERPDPLWVGDITYVKLGCEFVYLAVLMDVFTRSIRGWQLARSMEVELTLVALKRAYSLWHSRKARGRPEMHHRDQGVQYAAKAYTALLEERGIAISMAEVGEPTQNGYAERLMRTIKEEEVELSEYRNFEEAYQEIGKFLDDVYTKKRIHSSLGYLTPMEFENQ